MGTTVTLYKNTQTAGVSPTDIFANQWQMTPYTPPTMFHEGKTEEQAEFVVPSNIYLIPEKGDAYFMHGQNEKCELRTGKDGRPLAVWKVFENTQNYRVDTPSPAVFYRVGETPPEPPKPPRVLPKEAPTPGVWVPGKDANGNWEIF